MHKRNEPAQVEEEKSLSKQAILSQWDAAVGFAVWIGMHVLPLAGLPRRNVRRAPVATLAGRKANGRQVGMQ